MENYNNKKWLSDQILSVKDNDYMFNHFYNLLYLIVINRFKWIGLPSHIDVDFIEKELTNIGELAFVKDKKYGFQVCYCTGDNLNMYNRPTRYLCWTANNFINDYFNAEDIVIIRNNKLSENTHDFITRYASIISNVKKTKEINLNALKTPILIPCDESEYLTMKNIYAQYEGNTPVIYKTKFLDLDKFQVLKTDAPYLLDKLQQESVDNFNECLTFLGINTVAQKKERMITDEVNANNDMVNICLSIFLNSREEAIEEINKKFGEELKRLYNTEISLDLAEYCKRDFENVSRETNKEGDKNE